jgi:RNA polymerase sigma-70 factor (ECF subfamily)
LAGVRAHDEAAWRRLVDLYGPLVYYWCRRSGASDEDAQDLVQQVFAKVFIGLPGFRKDNLSDTFRGWLRTISQHVICDWARSSQKRAPAAGGTEAWQKLEGLPDRALLDETAALTESRSDLAARVLRLIQIEFPERAMKAFQLTVMQGLNATEAARQLRTTPEAVRKAKSRILRRLREELGDVE